MTHRRQFVLPLTGCLIAIIATSFGCAPNANGVMRPTLPWTRNVPTTSPGVGNPWGSQNDALAQLPSRPNLDTPSLATLPPAKTNTGRWSFMNDLMKRADQQELLAQRQRKELERLRLEEKSQYDKQRQYVITQRERERAAWLKEYENKERLLAQREKKLLGRVDQIRGNASNLDANNRDLHAQLAKTESDREILQDEIDLLKRRLADTSNQLSRTRQVSTETGKRLQALQASASRQRGNASIRANSSVTKPVTAVMVPGMDIRQDGDLVRIAVPADKIFMDGTAQLHQGSQPYMDQFAQILRQYYPRQFAGVEAHTDHSSTAIGSSQWRNHHQLTAAQSMSVFEQLTNRGIDAHQLFVSGHGGNHPIVSGGTTMGQALNKRVEIVVYPETYGR